MSSTTRDRRAGALVAVTAFLLCSTSAHADERDAARRTASVEDRARAADAYDQGTAAYLSEDYENAAHWFERAYRLVPTSAALLQAVRGHYKAGNLLRAANLSLELEASYPDDDRAMRVAHTVLGRAAPKSVLVHVRCDRPCTIELDGVLVRHSSFFVSADLDHRLKAAFEHGETSTVFSGSPGSVRETRLAAPAPPAPPPVPRWAFLSSLGATLALGATALWSGIDANRGVDAYEAAARTASSPGINENASPTPAERAQALLEEGQARERRTNILIGVTAGMAATTAVLGVFTNWKGESRAVGTRRVRPALGFARRGGAVSLEGRF